MQLELEPCRKCKLELEPLPKVRIGKRHSIATNAIGGAAPSGLRYLTAFRQLAVLAIDRLDTDTVLPLPATPNNTAALKTRLNTEPSSLQDRSR